MDYSCDLQEMFVHVAGSFLDSSKFLLGLLHEFKQGFPQKFVLFLQEIAAGIPLGNCAGFSAVIPSVPPGISLVVSPKLY